MAGVDTSAAAGDEGAVPEITPLSCTDFSDTDLSTLFSLSAAAAAVVVVDDADGGGGGGGGCDVLAAVFAPEPVALDAVDDNDDDDNDAGASAVEAAIGVDGAAGKAAVLSAGG